MLRKSRNHLEPAACTFVSYDLVQMEKLVEDEHHAHAEED